MGNGKATVLGLVWELVVASWIKGNLMGAKGVDIHTVELNFCQTRVVAMMGEERTEGITNFRGKLHSRSLRFLCGRS